jgi:hypothetical protein
MRNMYTATHPRYTAVDDDDDDDDDDLHLYI